MAAAQMYRVTVIAGGVLAEGPVGWHEYGEAAAAVRGVVAGLGARWPGWRVVARGVAVAEGPEAGGWCVVLVRGWCTLAEGAAGKAKGKARAKARPTAAPAGQA